ncbi:carbohydrate ABC transporter permease [Cohnella yongneupensis]|uniref:Carbohydrate ABC transporter permease n=1 Tax=Cohnella yongneupensis TaxID=425006 RepID=A0ABW0R2U2_9BACL
MASAALKPSRTNSISPLANVIVHGFFWLYSLACVLPVLLVIVVSLSNEDSVLLHGYQFFPEKFSGFAYEFLFRDNWLSIVKAYGYSTFITVAGTLVGVIMMALFAYPISRKDFPARKAFTFYVFFTMLFSGGLVPFYLTYVQYLDLKDSLLALIIPLLISPFFVLLMKTFFTSSIPSEVLESATIDGAGEFRIFWGIVLPLSLPVLATVALFTTLTYWNDWFLSMIFITTEDKISLQYLMYKTMLNIQYLTSNPNATQSISASGGLLNLPSETVRMAMCVVGIGPMMLAYPFFQRFFVKGLTVGAVKG